MAGGEYYHFGILAGIMSQLQSQQCDTMQQCILLQINIDGLPLFKSSNLQFWPILGIVDNMPSKSPFIIGLFCGVKKPTVVSEFVKDFISEMSILEREGFFFG